MYNIIAKEKFSLNKITNISPIEHYIITNINYNIHTLKIEQKLYRFSENKSSHNWSV